MFSVENTMDILFDIMHILLHTFVVMVQLIMLELKVADIISVVTDYVTDVKNTKTAKCGFLLIVHNNR